MKRVKQTKTGKTSLLVLCVLAAAGLSACGSSSTNNTNSSSSSSSTASSSATAKTLSGPAIKVGMICSCSGPEANTLAPTSTVIQAWAKSVNASGGINGYPVQVIVENDDQNPATGIQDAKTLVQQDHVMAIVGESSEVDSDWASYVASAGVPVVGGTVYEAPFQSNPDFYPSGTQLVQTIVGLATQAEQAKKKDLGVVYCAESPVCAELGPLGGAIAKLSGMTSFPEKISATAPSYTAPCLAAQRAGADAMFVGDNGAVVQRFVDGCAQQGYKPLVVDDMTVAFPSWLKDSTFDGTLLSSPNANTYDASTPAIQAFNAAMTKYTPGLLSSATYNYQVILPWAGGLLFQAAAKAAHLTPTSTPADVKKGLYALKNETLGGLAPPLNFTPGKPAFIPCYFTVQIKSGQFVSLNGDKPTCISKSELAALSAVLAG